MNEYLNVKCFCDSNKRDLEQWSKTKKYVFLVEIKKTSKEISLEIIHKSHENDLLSVNPNKYGAKNRPFLVFFQFFSGLSYAFFSFSA